MSDGCEDPKNMKECQIASIRNQVQLQDLKEHVKELRDSINKLQEELAKKGEEIKDVFYVADMTRARIDEVDEYLKSGIESLKDLVRKTREESVARDHDMTKVREDILTIREKAPKAFLVVAKWVAIILGLLIVLFPQLVERIKGL